MDIDTCTPVSNQNYTTSLQLKAICLFDKQKCDVKLITTQIIICLVYCNAHSTFITLFFFIV